MRNVIDLLEERGFIEAMTNDELRHAANKPLKVYCGFDPTADSLHIGNLVGIMGLAWFQRCGHTPVGLVGGATGRIGDPSGKDKERPLLTEEMIESNLKGIRANLEQVLDVHRQNTLPQLLNNYDWMKDYPFIDFLRDVGKLFRLGPMLAKESVKTRLQSPEGMSFAEFSYQLLQAYDFFHLNKEHGVSVQIGGSDQWGNITAGTELIRRLGGSEAYGLTFPLLTRSDGKKFGKTEQGTVWLSPNKLSPYEFYQYFYRVPDADVIKLLRMLTFLDMEEIKKIERSMAAHDYVPNQAQKRLAEEVTRIVHSQDGLDTALRITAGAAPGAHSVLTAETLGELAKDMPCCEIGKEHVIGKLLVDLFVLSGLQKSKGEARRLIRNGGAYLNNKQIESAREDYTLSDEHVIDGKFLLLSAGRKNKVVVKLTD